MAKELFFLFVLTVTSYSTLYSQERYQVLVVDNQTKLPIKDVHIKINTKIATITTDKGYFIFSKSIKIDSIVLTHLSYIKKTVFPENDKIGSIIYLEPATEQLDEVFLRTSIINKEIIPKTHKLFHKRYTAMEGFFSRELVTYLPNEKDIKGATIKSIIIQPYHDAWGDPNRMYMPFRVNLFSVDTLTHFPKEKLIPKGILVRRTKGTGKYVVIDISDLLIDFPKEGIFVSVETLSKKEYQKYRDISNEYPAFRYILKNKKSKYITYIRFYSEDKTKIIYDWGEPAAYDFIYLFGVELK